MYMFKPCDRLANMPVTQCEMDRKSGINNDDIQNLKNDTSTNYL